MEVVVVEVKGGRRPTSGSGERHGRLVGQRVFQVGEELKQGFGGRSPGRRHPVGGSRHQRKPVRSRSHRHDSLDRLVKLPQPRRRCQCLHRRKHPVVGGSRHQRKPVRSRLPRHDSMDRLVKLPQPHGRRCQCRRRWFYFHFRRIASGCCCVGVVVHVDCGGRGVECAVANSNRANGFRTGVARDEHAASRRFGSR